MTAAVAALAGALAIAVVLAAVGLRSAAASRAELRRLANYDILTGLPNRRPLTERLETILGESRRTTARVAVILIELRGFEHLNETYGHEVGDALMIAASDALRSAVRPEDFVVRYGGTRFVVTCPDVVDPTQATTRAVELIEAVQRPFEIGLDRIRIGASVGVALTDRDYATPDDVMLDATVALEEAAARGKGAVEVFDHATRSSATPSAAEHRLRQALARGEFWLLYLPVLSLLDHRLVGVEALLRWADPAHGLVSPATFMRSLDETGLIVPVGNWVLREAARQSKEWQDAFPAHRLFETTVNISPRQLVQSDFFDNVVTAVEESDVDPRRLCLEIAEGSLMRDPDEVWSMLRQAKQLGCPLALDDFGTGHSSLAYLRRFKLDRLKIDHTFIAGLPGSPEDTSIVEHIIGLARALDMQPVAEGIENVDQVSALIRAGCETGQGYYFSTPQPASVISSLLEKGTLDDEDRPPAVTDMNDPTATVVHPEFR